MIILTLEQKKLLRRIVKSSKRHRVRQRSYCVLLRAAGYTAEKLALIFEVTIRTIFNWLSSWQTYHLAGLYDEPGRGRKAKLKPSQYGQIKQWVAEYPLNLKKVQQLIEEQFGLKVSKDTLKRLLKTLKMSWHRIRRVPKKKPAPLIYELKKAELAQLKQAENRGEIDLFFGDESGFCLNSSTPYAWQSADLPLEIPTGRGSRLNVIGFLSRKQILHAWTFDCAINSHIVISCLDILADKINKKTVVVLDQASFHTSAAVTAKLAEWRDKNLHLFFLPVYSPQLNLIEILWRFMKYYWITLAAFTDWKHLVEYVKNVILFYGSLYEINFA